MSKRFHLAATALLASLIAGCSAVASVAGPTTDPSRPTPSARATNSQGRSAFPIVSPFASLAGYLNNRAGQITAAVYDRRTRKTWLFNRGVRQDTASIVKVEIMGTALWQAQQGRPLSAAERALIRTMIENSDNDAATKLLADVGGPSAVQRFDRRAGLHDTTLSRLRYIPGTPSWPGWGLTTTTAFDEVRLVSRFAYPNSVLTTASRRYGLNLMEHVESDQAWGVSGGNYGVLSGATVALKNGWLPHNVAANSDWQINSIGWVSGHGRDYVLAVLTNHNPTSSYGIETIDTIARRIYSQLGARSGFGA